MLPATAVSSAGTKAVEAANLLANAPSTDALSGDTPSVENDSLVALLREAIEALAKSDAKRLEGILSRAHGVTLPAGTELAEARSLHRLLGALLNETDRNQRLLRRSMAAPGREWYGPAPS